MERRRALNVATVVVPSRFLPVLREQFGRHCTDEEDLGDGRTRCALAAPTPLDLARHLAGWGSGLDVEGPGSVRRELGRIGRELTEAYGSDA